MLNSLKIFISSTCRDLEELRHSLKSSLEAVGHEVVLSEKDDILFDPRDHTHVSCVKAVTECDLVVFIIAKRRGGTAIESALSMVDLERLENSNIDFFSKNENLQVSISQCEVLTSFANNIPVFTFIKEDVYNQHEVYERNKSKDIIDKMEMPGFKNIKEAKYIFEFFNFVRKERRSNYVKPFQNADDIVKILKDQLSGLFARLLKDTRSEVLANNDLEILSATVVAHLSTARQKAFDRLYLNVNKGDTIKIMGTGVTSFLGHEERIRGYLKDGNTIQILMINNNVIKDGLHCTSDVFMNNLNNIGFGKTVQFVANEIKVNCYLASTNFLIDEKHFNNYHNRPEYNKNVQASVELIHKYRADPELSNYKGKFEAKFFRSFTPFSITALSGEKRKKNDLIAEFIIPFAENRILFHSNDSEDATVYNLFMKFFNSTWEKSTDII